MATDLFLEGLFDFNATSVVVSANTDAGAAWLARHFGAGCVSASVRKSAAGDVTRSVEAEGLTWGGDR